MKVYFFKLLIFISLFCLFTHFAIVRVGAQGNTLRNSQSSTVTATVGEYYLDISGYQSPNASLVLNLPDGTFVRSTTADTNGYFYISQVLVKADFSGFCLIATDYKNLGDSETCIDVPPGSGSIVKKDLFLPPTLGFANKEIKEGSDAVTFGYTMSNAIVNLFLSDGQKVTTTANAVGYYEFTIKNLQAGVYQLYAMGNYQEKDSLRPTKYKELTILTLAEQYRNYWKEFWKRVRDFLTSLGLGPLWIAIPILILIIILLMKLYPNRFTFIYESRMYSSVYNIFHKKKKLHHAWFMGY